jgi:hypothetical protein
LLAKPKNKIDYQSVTDIIGCQTIKDMNTAVLNFITAVDEAREENNN